MTQLFRLAYRNLGRSKTRSLLSAREFAGEVVDVNRIGSMLGGNVVFKVIIAFDGQPRNLLWGMTAEVSIAE